MKKNKEIETKNNQKVSLSDFYAKDQNTAKDCREKEEEIDIETLVQSLTDNEWVVREQAYKKLEELKDVRAQDSLIRLLKDKSAEIRKRSAELLGILGNEKSVNPLKEILDDKDSDVREAALSSYLKLEEVTVSFLIKVLNEEKNDKIRLAALTELSKLKDPAAFDVLLKISNDKRENYGIRFFAAEGLADLKDERAISPLIDQLQAEHWVIRNSALNTLKSLKAKIPTEILISLLHDESRLNREYSARLLGQQGDSKAIDSLIILLQDEKEDNKVRRAAAEALGELNAISALDIMVEVFGDSRTDTWVRDGLAIALGDLGIVAKDSLDRIIDTSNKFIRSNIAKAFGLMGDLAVLESIKFLLKDTEYEVRRQAVEALENLGDKSVGDIVIEMLSDNHYLVRMFALQALGELEYQEAVDDVIPLLKDQNYKVKREAAGTLLIFKDSRSTPALIDSLTDVRDYETKAWIIAALGIIGDPIAEEHIKEGLDHSKDFVRNVAAGALIIFGDKQATEYYLNTCKENYLKTRKNFKDVMRRYTNSLGEQVVYGLRKPQNVEKIIESQRSSSKN